MGWLPKFLRKKLPEPVVAESVEAAPMPAPKPKRVNVDWTEDTARAVKLRQYIVGRLNGAPRLLLASLPDLAAEVEKHPHASWYASAKAKLMELESIEARG